MTVPPRPVADTTVDAAWGQAVHDLTLSPVFGLYGGTGGSITHQVLVNLYWTDIYDTFNMQGTAEPWKVFVPQSGIYHVAASCVWANGSSAGQRYLAVQLNGANPNGKYIAQSTPAISTVQMCNSASGDIAATAGQYIGCQVYQDSGAAINLLECRLSVRKVAEIPS